jgi:hypothetical protein
MAESKPLSITASKRMNSSKPSHTWDSLDGDIPLIKVKKYGNGQETPEQAVKVDDTVQEQSTTSISLLLVAPLLAMFLVGLDRTIISTVRSPKPCSLLSFICTDCHCQAIPRITDDFKSFDDVGWYGAAYLLTCCAFQLQFGMIYTYFPIKINFLASIVLFEIGSVVCGAAPSSTAFIVGRAISGIGAEGIFAGSVSADSFF